jgi:hypothetical protein
VRVAADEPRRDRAAERDDVLGGRALLALHHVALDALALGQRLEAAALDGRVVDEEILAAVLGRDEAEALGVVEPLHGAGRTHGRAPEKRLVLCSDRPDAVRTDTTCS